MSGTICGRCMHPMHWPLHCSLACGATIAAEYARLTDLKGATDGE